MPREGGKDGYQCQEKVRSPSKEVGRRHDTQMRRALAVVTMREVETHAAEQVTLPANHGKKPVGDIRSSNV